MIAKQRSLFDKKDVIHYGDDPRRRDLFLPARLKKLSRILITPEVQNAWEVMKKWADLEMSGKLDSLTESAIEGEFVREVFGEALGYSTFAKGREHWDIQQKVSLNGHIADAAIGKFAASGESELAALIELKGPATNLDRDRFQGRTAVQQCWDYLNAAPECPWGIVSNIVSFRLYHRNNTPNACQLFALQDLRHEEVFLAFYHLFGRGGILPATAFAHPRALVLLEETRERQREVGDELYKAYDNNRRKMIYALLRPPHDKTLDQAIHIAQKLLDRIVFVAFCKDRDLLPNNVISKAYTHVEAFSFVTNPKWRNFKRLFQSVDQGNAREGISAFDGGLFEKDGSVDDLELDDSWTEFFNTIGNYDFSVEVNVDVLGHLFEKSVSEVGRIRTFGLLESDEQDEDKPKMPKSAERKRGGVYYTPPDFTAFIVRNTLGKVIDERFAVAASRSKVKSDEAVPTKATAKYAEYYRACLDVLRGLRVVDPACGSGAFLIAAYDYLADRYFDVIDNLAFHDESSGDQLREQVPGFILKENLYGVDFSEQAVQITQLALWIRSAEKGKLLSKLSENIVWGNSLVSDPNVHPQAMVWESAFASVFERESPGFDCVIGNPPWERMKLQEREFFDAEAPEIASAVNAATRRTMIETLKKANPELHARYEAAKDSAERTLDHVRTCGRFPLTGKGDINTYAVFAELAASLVSPTGCVGLLVPSGIATDNTTKEFFASLVDKALLYGLFDFENRNKIFPDVDGRFKFSVLLFSGPDQKSEVCDFSFFAHSMDDLKDKSRQITLSIEDIRLLNPNTHTCPIFRTRRDAELTKAIYRRVPVLVDLSRKEGGDPWGIKFQRMFDQTNDAELFHTSEQLKGMEFKREGAIWKKGKQEFLPLYEAKMIQMYDHRAASVVVKGENWMRQGQTADTTLVEHQNPEFTVTPRWWVTAAEVEKAASRSALTSALVYKDITSATNQRTMIASFISRSGALNSAPLISVDATISLQSTACFLANLNSLALDFVARQKVGGVHLNFFIVEQLPILAPDIYAKRCPWNSRQTLEKWVSDRVLKLTCTSNDMIPLAEAAGFDPPVHKWDPQERAELIAELDAAYFLLYGIEREDVEYILTTFQGIDKEESGLFGGQGVYDLILSSYDRHSGKK